MTNSGPLRRVEVVNLRLTSLELRRLDQLAGASGVTRSQLVREMIAREVGQIESWQRAQDHPVTELDPRLVADLEATERELFG